MPHHNITSLRVLCFRLAFEAYLTSGSAEARNAFAEGRDTDFGPAAEG